jgi:hypothetical protein
MALALAKRNGGVAAIAAQNWRRYGEDKRNNGEREKQSGAETIAESGNKADGGAVGSGGGGVKMRKRNSSTAAGVA